MDLPWGDERSYKFVGNVGLITSDGPHGMNIMAAEWTHHISYSPGFIAIFLGHNKATTENIRETREFGVSIAAIDQTVLTSIAGGYSGKSVDKVAALKELGFKFHKAEKINTLMVEGASMNAECRVIEEIPLGDHVMFVGKIIEAKASNKEPLVYHQGKYWKLTEQIKRISEEDRVRIKNVVENYSKVYLTKTSVN